MSVEISLLNTGTISLLFHIVCHRNGIMNQTGLSGSEITGDDKRNNLSEMLSQPTPLRGLRLSKASLM